jgi:hypothetical protein
MVPCSHAVVDPGTVMIEALDTHVANATMPGPASSYDLAVGAKHYRVEVL